MVMDEFSLSRQRRDFADALPAPLSETKPHTLSLRPSLPRKTSSASQIQSTLLGKLPPEIRVVIWKYIIGNQEVHIVSKFGRIGHTICDAGYWAENRADRPDLRASSYMFTYGTLPTTKQLADWNMLSLLRTCRLIYTEASPLLYTTNTFTFRDLRTIPIFRASITPVRWASIRSINIYAMFYRLDDIPAACEARSILQLEAWPSVISALKSLPRLRYLRIWIANPFYLDQKYFNGERTGLYGAVRGFLLQLKGVKIKEGLEVVSPLKRMGSTTNNKRWNTKALKNDHLLRLEEELGADGLDCRVLVGNNEFGVVVGKPTAKKHLAFDGSAL